MRTAPFRRLGVEDMIWKNRWLGATAVVAVSTLAQPALAQERSFNIPA